MTLSPVCPSARCCLRISTFVSLFAIVLLACATSGPCFGQDASGKWDDIVGKKIVNRDGVTLGYVLDTAIDLENGRYVGVVVGIGGFLGIGEKKVLIPAFALTVSDAPRTLFLDMDVAKFRAAPTFELSNKLGPPSATQLAELYHYYGQQPYFTTDLTATPAAGETLAQLGFIQLGSRILLMPVDNLQGKPIGWVYGLRGLKLGNEPFKGVVIMPINSFGSGDYKIVEPEALRYNSRHNRLRLNDHEQAFGDSPNFAINAGGHYREQSPERPGNPLPPLVQGNSANDKLITSSIQKAILADASLSHYAKTVEVATVQGKTTVRGRAVNSQGHDQIIAYASKAAGGAGNVTDLVTVQSQSASEKAIDTH